VVKSQYTGILERKFEESLKGMVRPVAGAMPFYLMDTIR